MSDAHTDPAAKPPLTRERILAEAVAFADEHGVDALTMRKLAERLDAGAMSLYTHVRNKDDMIEGMIDLVTADMVVPEGSDWRAAMRRSASSAHQVLLAHPWAAEGWTSHMPGPARLALMDGILRCLTQAGLDDELVYHGYHAITMHIVGFTIQELGYRNLPSGQELGDVARAFLDHLAAAELPHLARHVQAHLSDHDHGDEFGFVLDLVLDGLERANGGV